MAIDTLITDVHGETYIVLEAADGIAFAPCDYDHIKNTARYLPSSTMMLRTFENLKPLEQHEAKIRKLIAVNRQINMPITDCLEANQIN